MAKITFVYCGISYTWRMRNVAGLKGSFKECRVGGGTNVSNWQVFSAAAAARIVVQAVRQRSVYVIWTNVAAAAAFSRRWFFLHMPATCAHIPICVCGCECVGVCVCACKYRIADSSNFIWNLMPSLKDAAWLAYTWQRNKTDKQQKEEEEGDFSH